MTIDFNFYVHKHRKELDAIPALITDEHDEHLSDMTVWELTDAIAAANAMLWELMYVVDSEGNIRRRKPKP
jgi:hypothetical protein